MAAFLDDLDARFDFTNMHGYPNDMPKLGKLPTFDGANAITVDDNWSEFTIYMKIVGGNRLLDDFYICVSLSLQGEADKWFTSMSNHNIDTLKKLREVFYDRRVKIKYYRLSLNDLMRIRRNENETIDQFHIIFD